MKTKLKRYILVTIFAFFFISCNGKQIDEMNVRINELTVALNNQTSLINRVLGENIPVIMPKESQNKLNYLMSSVADLSNTISDEKLETSVSLYMDYIKTTAPWIQEVASEDILYAKYTIDYYTIINDYIKSKDIEICLSSLQSFIMTSNDYKDIQIVINKYNELVEVQNTQYEIEINKLNIDMSNAFANKNISYDELADILKRLEPYMEEEKLSENIKKLDGYLSEADAKEQVKEELETLKNQLQSIEKNELAEDTYKIFTEKLAVLNYSANSIKLLENSDLLKSIDNALVLINDLNESVRANQETEILNQIKKSLAICNNEIDNLDSTLISNSMISMLATQLASLKFTASSLTIVDTRTVLQEIQSTIKLLDGKTSLITENISKKEKQDLKNYNTNALNRISKVKKQNDDIGILDSDKKSRKIELMIQLEEIQINYLYMPVSTLYQQIYQEIWNSLDSDSRFAVSRRALNITRKELDENF